MFTTVWSNEAFDRMGQIVRNNPARSPELGAALREMSDLLARDPLETGESRWDDWRVTFPGPLAVYYRVDVEHQVVEIAQVRLVR
jgi:hypothetical protein